MGDISNIEDLDLEKHLQQRDIEINQDDAGGHLIILPKNGFTGMSRVDIYCNFVNSLRVSSVNIPYREQTEEFFTYSSAEYNNGLDEKDKIVGFSTVGYKLRYPNNDNTYIFAVDEGNNKYKKYLKVELTNDDKENRYIGFHDNVLIPLDTTFREVNHFTDEISKNVSTIVDKAKWKVVDVALEFVEPYIGSTIAEVVRAGGKIIRYLADVYWDHGKNYGVPPSDPEDSGYESGDDNESQYRLKLYKNDEVPVINEKTRSVDFVSDDDPYVPGDKNIVDDRQEPIWAGSTGASFDILEELEYTMDTNNDTFVFDIDDYNSDPVVAAAAIDSPRPIGIKRVKIHTSVPVTPTQTKSVSYGSNGDYIITPDNGYNLSSVSVNVATPTYNIGQISNYPVTQLGTVNVPIPSGYDAVDSVSLNVNVPNKKKLYKIVREKYVNGTKYPSNYLIDTNNFKLADQNFSISTTSSDEPFYIEIILDSTNNYYICNFKRPGRNVTFNVSAGTFYMYVTNWSIGTNSYDYIKLYDEDDNLIFSSQKFNYDSYRTDTTNLSYNNYYLF